MVKKRKKDRPRKVKMSQRVAEAYLKKIEAKQTEENDK